jgi:hypothetical protein
MKKLFFGISVIALAFTSCNQEAKAEIKDENLAQAAETESAVDSKFAEITFENDEHDFGTVNEGDIVEHTFKFTNTGEAPLILVDAKPSCGCTVPTWTREPVQPGESGQVAIRFNTAGKPNSQTKTVTIKANTEEGTKVVRIKGMVTPKAAS